MSRPNNTWGGSRPGAGRKTQGEPQTATITLRVSPAVKTRLRQQAEAAGKPIGRLIEEMLFEREARE